MDGSQINRVLWRNPITKRFFLGTFPADHIPVPREFPASLVVNMDNSNLPGSHWVAMFFPTPSRVVYYDSYGIMPSNVNIKRYLVRFPIIEMNPITFQSILTDVCGYYVIYYLYMCSLGYRLHDIQTILDGFYLKDRYVVDYVNKYVL